MRWSKMEWPMGRYYLPYYLPCILTALLLTVAILPTPAEAGELIDRLKTLCHHPPPGYVPAPMQMAAGTPGPHRYPEYNTGSYPWYGYGFGVPSYRWGYFGAKYRPIAITHKGYHGNYSQWGYRHGY